MSLFDQHRYSSTDYDGLLILEAPDDATATADILHSGAMDIPATLTKTIVQAKHCGCFLVKLSGADANIVRLYLR